MLASFNPSAGTEIGGAYFTGSPLLPQSPSTFSTPTVGHRPVILCSPAQPGGAPRLSPHGDTTGEHCCAVGFAGSTCPPMLNSHARLRAPVIATCVPTERACAVPCSGNG